MSGGPLSKCELLLLIRGLVIKEPPKISNRLVKFEASQKDQHTASGDAKSSVAEPTGKKISSSKTQMRKRQGSKVQGTKCEADLSKEPPATEKGPEVNTEPFLNTDFTVYEADKLTTSLTQLAMMSQDKPEIDLKLFSLILKKMSTSDYFMTRRVFQVFDKHGNGKLSPVEMIKALSTLFRGTLEEQIEYAFSVYDTSEKGFLSKSDVASLLQQSQVKDKSIGAGDLTQSLLTYQLNEIEPDFSPDSEYILGLEGMIFPKLDNDKDGKISLGDFRCACVKDPTLVEALGVCLPQNSNGHNAHRVSQWVGPESNISNRIVYLTKAALCAQPSGFDPNTCDLMPLLKIRLVDKKVHAKAFNSSKKN